jgi:hypothetical protein
MASRPVLDEVVGVRVVSTSMPSRSMIGSNSSIDL